MSDETVQRLSDAQSHLDATRAAARAREQEFLDAAAASIPQRVDELARGVTQRQAEVARGLGKEGITQLRDELRTCATEIAAEVAGAIDDVAWPHPPQSQFSTISPADVSRILFKFLYGKRTDRLAAVFMKHGFDIQDDSAQRAQGLVHPYTIYSVNEDRSRALAEAIDAIADATRALNEAKAADDQDAVNSLWED